MCYMRTGDLLFLFSGATLILSLCVTESQLSIGKRCTKLFDRKYERKISVISTGI